MSAGNKQPGSKVGCRVCAHDLDPVLPSQGQYTHPTCDPQLDRLAHKVRRAARRQDQRDAADRRAFRQGGELLDLYGNPRADL